jgi:hypothetical protein
MRKEKISANKTLVHVLKVIGRLVMTVHYLDRQVDFDHVFSRASGTRHVTAPSCTVVTKGQTMFC